MNETGESLTSKAEAAFRQAAEAVVRRARQMGTPIVIWEDGQIREVPADSFKLSEPPRPAADSARTD